MENFNTNELRTIYLVDTENISNSQWIGLIDLLKVGDKMYVMYSNYSGTCDLNQISIINNKSNQMKFVECINGSKNALDFQLSSLLGKLIQKKKSTRRYIIVSDDNGFNCLKYFWNKFGIEVARKSVDSVITETCMESSFNDCDIDILKNALIKKTLLGGGFTDITDIVVNKVRNILDTEPLLNNIHNKLNKQFGNIGKDYYKVLKGILKNYYEL